MNISELQAYIQAIYPSAVFMKDYTLTTVTGGEAQIALWNNSLGPQPTSDQLSAEAAVFLVRNAAEAKINQLEKAYTVARYQTPVTITSNGTELKFPTDTPTQTNVAGYITAYLENPPAAMPLQDAFGNVQMISIADVKAIARAIGDQSISAFVTLINLIGQVKGATSIEEVQAVNWPS